MPNAKSCRVVVFLRPQTLAKNQSESGRRSVTVRFRFSNLQVLSFQSVIKRVLFVRTLHKIGHSSCCLAICVLRSILECTQFRRWGKYNFQYFLKKFLTHWQESKKLISAENAPLPQLDRGTDYESVRRGFESLMAHH